MLDITTVIPMTITSMEVAEMVEKTHKALLKDIRRYTKQIREAEENPQFSNGGKIDPVDFWTENTYSDAKGESRPCYDVTVMGCEFIAHKMTGTKGTLFTALYVKRFHEMEDEIRAKQTSIPERQTSSLPAPVAKTWYDRNRPRLYEIGRKYSCNMKTIIKHILVHLNSKFDIKEAKRIYKEQTGHDLEYNLDLLDFYPEMEEVTDKFVDKMLSE